MTVQFFDDNLVNYSGHNADYINNLVDELETRKIDSIICCNQNILSDFKTLAKVKNVFSLRSADLHSKGPFSNFGKLGQIFRLIYSNIIFSFNYLKCTKSTRLSVITIISDLSPRNAFGFSFWLFYISIVGVKTNFVIILHDRAPTIQYYLLKFYNFIGFRQKVHFVAQSKMISEDYRNRFKRDILFLPTPQINNNSIQYPIAQDNDNIIFTYLGLASKAKGFLFLIDFFLFLIENNKIKEVDAFTFIVQNNGFSDDSIKDETEKKIKRILESSLKTKWINGGVPEAEFLSYLHCSNAILVPYNPEQYQFIQSGVCTQSIAYGVPVIVSKGTTSALEAKSYGTSIEFEFGNFNSFLGAIKTFSTKSKDMVEESRRKSIVYKEFHGAKNYIDLIFKEFVFPTNK